MLSSFLRFSELDRVPDLSKLAEGFLPVDLLEHLALELLFARPVEVASAARWALNLAARAAVLPRDLVLYSPEQAGRLLYDGPRVLS